MHQLTRRNTLALLGAAVAMPLSPASATPVQVPATGAPVLPRGPFLVFGQPMDRHDLVPIGRANMHHKLWQGDGRALTPDEERRWGRDVWRDSAGRWRVPNVRITPAYDIGVRELYFVDKFKVPLTRHNRPLTNSKTVVMAQAYGMRLVDIDTRIWRWESPLGGQDWWMLKRTETAMNLLPWFMVSEVASHTLVDLQQRRSVLLAANHYKSDIA